MRGSDAHDRIRGGLLGLATGDALGAPLEGTDRAVAEAAIRDGLAMTGGGSWEAGETTDDTAMALALAESIAEWGLLDVDDLARRYIAWATSDGKGIGRTTHQALVGANDAADARVRALAHYEAIGLAAGNGTVMRAAPIGLVARASAEAVKAAARDAELTHADPAARVASESLCAALVTLRDVGDPLAAAQTQAQSDQRVAEAVGLVVSRDAAAIGELAGSEEMGACWTTLAVALYALVVIDDYERGVSWAIGLGGDTDTNAAVAGALLGARHGVESIPTRWLDRLRQRERIERAADGLALLTGE